VSQSCTIKPSSNWSVSVESVEADCTKDYDYAFPSGNATKPDIYVELTVGGQVKKTKVISDTCNPVFNEFLLTATASELMGSIQIRVYDYDPIGADDPIADCQETIYESELESGSATLYYPCPSTDLKSIKFTFVPTA
jgi:hypothetical protein